MTEKQMLQLAILSAFYNIAEVYYTAYFNEEVNDSKILKVRYTDLERNIHEVKITPEGNCVV